MAFSSGALGLKCIGEITNDPGKGFQYAIFVLSVYDTDDRLLTTSYINVSNIPNEVTKSFTAFLMGATSQSSISTLQDSI